MARYNYSQNDPFDRSVPIVPLLEPRMSSRDFMRSIREFTVPPGAVAFWFLGQNCFVVKPATGPLCITDPYLSDSIPKRHPDLPFRANRQLPVFIEPEDLDVDYVLCTHSHSDHTDPETIRRIPKGRIRFVGPYQSTVRFRECGVPDEQMQLIHPKQTLELAGLTVTGTFAMPTDETDLNHMGLLLRFADGLCYWNSGDTAYHELLGYLKEENIDLATICINGGFLNLSHFDAARIVKLVGPKIAIPCHYDMMVNNVQDPVMFRTSLEVVGASAEFRILEYYEPFLLT